MVVHVTLYLYNITSQVRAKRLNEATHEYVMKMTPTKCGATSGDVIAPLPLPFEHDESYFCTQMHCTLCGWNGVYSGRFQDLPIDMPWQHTRPLPDYSRDMRSAWTILQRAQQEKLVHVSQSYNSYLVLKRFCYALFTSGNLDTEDVESINPYVLNIGIEDIASLTADRIATSALLSIGIEMKE